MKKKLTILSIVVVLLLGLLICSKSFASTTLSIGGTNSEANTTIPASSATPTPAATARVVTNTATVNTATASTATANTTASNNIPKTGEVEDYIIFGLIVVFIIAGIITYKKVNSYNSIDM